MHPRWTASPGVAPRANSVAIPPSERLASPAPRRSRHSRGFIHGLLALCVWLSGCGRGSVLPEAGPAPRPCADSDDGAGFAYALLRVECDGTLRPGRASWTVSNGAVTLDFPAGTVGPKGAELVTMWPSLGQPPWLGHRVRGIVVLSGGGIRVEFGDPVRDPARLFADPRLAGAVTVVRVGDARDAIDGNEAEIVTRHDPSIEYARSLGRTVRLLTFDRLYLVAFAGGADGGGASALAADVGSDWVGMGAVGARRLPSLTWQVAGGECKAGMPEAAADVARAGEPAAVGPTANSAATPRPSVSYREGDIAARQIAERVVSAGLRTGPSAAVVAGLTGSGERMVVRPVAEGEDSWTEMDVAAVIGVRAGPVHPCSLHAEALRMLAGWREGPGRRGGTVLPIGEAAAFEIGGGTGWGT